jgi:hypothetical protein
MSFPAKTEDGKTVQIVSKETAGELVILIDELGNRYTTQPHAAHVLIDYGQKVVEEAEGLLQKAEAFEDAVVTKAEGYLKTADEALNEVEVEAYPTTDGGEAEAAPVTEPEATPPVYEPEVSVTFPGTPPEADVAQAPEDFPPAA